MKNSILFYIMFFIVTSCYSQEESIYLEVIGTYETGIFNASGAEIPAYDAATKRIFFTNSASNSIEILDISDPANPQALSPIDLSPYGAGPNSIAVKNGLVAVAVEADPKTDNGHAVFFDTDGNFQFALEVGALPDMLTFTPDGNRALVANEGEPENGVDPEGSVSVINVNAQTVTMIDFGVFNNYPLMPSIRIFPGKTVAEDLEPEYIAVSSDGSMAWVSCQENNALIFINLSTLEPYQLTGMGYKDHNLQENTLDASDVDEAINITNWPVKGMFMPDAIAYSEYNSSPFVLSANEGDSRDEDERVENIVLDVSAFPDAAFLQLPENLGRLDISLIDGDIDNDGEYEELYSYGTRSFSVWNGTTGELIWDSGNDFEEIISQRYPDNFNSDNNENGTFDLRSDNKGCEPEGIVTAKIGDERYVFILLERIGGIMVYNITIPYNPAFVQYINNRNFAGNPANGTAGDLGPEGAVFIPAADSPDGSSLLVVANEVSGTVTIYRINEGFIPVELTAFTAAAKDNKAILRWTTASEKNNRGFWIEKADGDGAFRPLFFVEGAGTSAEINNYQFTDENLKPGVYRYRLKQEDFDGRFEYSGIRIVEIPAPVEFELMDNYPNPFNPSTDIKFSLPARSEISLVVYDLLGREVAVLYDGICEAGVHTVTFNGSELSSGVFIYKLTSGKFSAVKKMNMIK